MDINICDEDKKVIKIENNIVNVLWQSFDSNDNGNLISIPYELNKGKNLYSLKISITGNKYD